MASLRSERVERCRNMLARLQPDERSEFIRLMTIVAGAPTPGEDA